MGVIIHHAIVATHYKEDVAEQLVSRIQQEMPDVIVTATPPAVNGYVTIFVAPDGSKEGWLTSKMGDRDRQRIKEMLSADSGWDWVEISYGECRPAISDTTTYTDASVC